MQQMTVTAFSANDEKPVISLQHNSTITLVGKGITTEKITVEIPAVPDPVPANDAHWEPLMQNDVAVVLRYGHNADRIVGNYPQVRLNKTAGVGGLVFGIGVS